MMAALEPTERRRKPVPTFAGGESNTTVRSDLLRRMTIGPAVITGKPNIRGIRITLEQVLQAPATGAIEPELLDDCPELECGDMGAVVADTS